jgi:beta-lactamase class D
MRNLLASCLALCVLLAACAPNNIKQDDSIKTYFDKYKVTGTFGMFDNSQGDFTIYNLSRFVDSTYLPASTFKVVNSLIALETGVATNDSVVIPWSGLKTSREECDQNLPMYQAFRQSCVPWFQELARRIGKDTMQRWLDTLGYGSRYNRVQVKDLDTFWLDNSVKITADEQIGLMKKLYFDQLPFKKWTQRIVKSMMLMDSTNKYKLSYKTGWGYRENGNSIGWVVGWIEENRHPYPFVLQIESPDRNADLASVRLNLLNDIFKHYGFKEGNK